VGDLLHVIYLNDRHVPSYFDTPVVKFHRIAFHQALPMVAKYSIDELRTLASELEATGHSPLNLSRLRELIAARTITTT
jgi:hypothetical protein